MVDCDWDEEGASHRKHELCFEARLHNCSVVVDGEALDLGEPALALVGIVP